jgi:hypothetical protein
MQIVTRRYLLAIEVRFIATMCWMEPNPLNRRRLQFSLRTALLLIVLVAAGTSLWISVRQHRQIERLRADNTRLRNEVGEINVEEENENNLQAIRIPTNDAKQWQWRVFVPKGRQFNLDAVLSQIPTAGAQVGPETQLFIAEGYHTISLKLQKGKNDTWNWSLQTGAAGAGRAASDETIAWAENTGFRSIAEGVSSQTSVEPEKDLQLLRLRLVPGNSAASNDLPIAGPGVLLWISEK